MEVEGQGGSFSLSLSLSAVEECETRGETSLTDGGTLTQFAEWVRDGAGVVVGGAWRGLGRGAPLVFSRAMCSAHVGPGAGNTQDFSKQAAGLSGGPDPPHFLHNQTPSRSPFPPPIPHSSNASLLLSSVCLCHHFSLSPSLCFPHFSIYFTVCFCLPDGSY